jgi:hypothetical protein
MGVRKSLVKETQNSHVDSRPGCGQDKRSAIANPFLDE